MRAPGSTTRYVLPSARQVDDRIYNLLGWTVGIHEGDARDPPHPLALVRGVAPGSQHYAVTRLVEWEAYELVEHGLLTDADFREFTCDNAIRLHGGMNPRFFDGTSVEAYAKTVLGPETRQI